MSNWKILTTEHTLNYVLNPSVEIAGNYGALGASVINRHESGGAYGHAMLEVVCNADNEGVSFTLSTLPGAAACYVTVCIIELLNTVAGHWDWSVNNDANQHEPEFIMTLGGTAAERWQLYGYAFNAGEGGGATSLRIRQNGATAIEFYIDGVQVEIEDATHWTTFCDGDQPGCSWDGTPHASTSRRTASSRQGGQVRDLKDEYGFEIGGMLGVGSGKHNLIVDSYALLPGGEINNDKLAARDFTISGSIRGTSWSNYHDKRGELIAILTSQGYPNDARGPQATRLWYTGTDRAKYVDAIFKGGLELKLNARRDPCYFERNIALRFLAPNPIWHEVVNDSLLLDTNDVIAVNCLAGKIFSIPNIAAASLQGIWDDLSVGAITPGIIGPSIHAIAVGPDHRIYVGGDFTDLDGIPACDFIAVYDPFLDTWAALGGGFNNTVYALLFGPDGTLYAGGNFTNGDVAAPDADADHLAQWSAGAWSAVGGAGLRNNIVQDIIFDRNGNLIIGGDFNNWMGLGADFAATWDGVAWATLEANQLNSSVYSMAIGPDGDIYLGGQFTQIGAVANSANYIVGYDGSAYYRLGSANTAGGNGTNGNVYAIDIDRSGNLYLGGAFTTAMGDTVNRVALWNGTMFEALGGGLGGIVRAMEIGPDDILWVGGAFTSTTDLSWIERLARWKDNSWASADISVPGVATIYTLALGAPDPVLTANYDIFIGFDTTGNAAVAGDVGLTTTRLGSYRTFPSIHIERSGGTAAHILSLKNTTTGDELNLDYALRDGERLSIDLTPTKKSITSSFYGARPDAILPNSDLGSWAILSRAPGSDYPVWAAITAFVDVTGAPTVTAWLEWQNAYEGLDSD